MKIKEIGSLNLNETTFKLSDNSITARVNDKTKAVINDIRFVKSIPFREQVELNGKFRGFNKFFDGLYIGVDKTLYYFIDNRYHELVCKMASNGDNNEFIKLNEKVTELSKNGVNVLFVNIA